MGEAPCAADATVFAFINSASTPFFSGDLQAYVAGKGNLAAYLVRMREQYGA